MIASEGLEYCADRPDVTVVQIRQKVALHRIGDQIIRNCMIAFSKSTNKISPKMLEYKVSRTSLEIQFKSFFLSELTIDLTLTIFNSQTCSAYITYTLDIKTTFDTRALQLICVIHWYFFII